MTYFIHKFLRLFCLAYNIIDNFLFIDSAKVRFFLPCSKIFAIDLEQGKKNVPLQSQKSTGDDTEEFPIYRILLHAFAMIVALADVEASIDIALLAAFIYHSKAISKLTFTPVPR